MVTILSLDPGDLRHIGDQRSVGVHPAGRLPPPGPSAVRVALIDGTWSASHRRPDRARRKPDMVVAGPIVEGDAYHDGRSRGHRNVVELVEGGAQAPTERGGRAKLFIAALCTAQQELATPLENSKLTVDFPVFPDYGEDVLLRCPRWPPTSAGRRVDHRR